MPRRPSAQTAEIRLRIQDAADDRPDEDGAFLNVARLVPLVELIHQRVEVVEVLQADHFGIESRPPPFLLIVQGTC